MLTPLSHHKTHLNFTQLNTPQLNSSHLIFGPSAAPILEPLGPPNRSKIGPSRLLTPYFYQKLRLSRNGIKTNTKPTKMTPRRPPRRAKIDPRRLQDDLQEHLFSTSFLSSILVRLGSHFGLILAPLWALKPGRPQDPAGSKMTLNQPRRSKTAQDGLKTAQDASKTPQDPSKMP